MSPASEPTPGHLRGAVDLSGLKARASQPAPGAPGGPGASGPGADGAAGAPEGTWVVRGVGEAELQQLVQLSGQVPVLVHLATASSDASRQIDDVLAPAVDRLGGRLVLADVDVDAQPQLLQVFGLSAGPAVVGILAGQPVPLLNQPADQQQIDSLLEELLQVAAQNGMSGAVQPFGPAEPGQGADRPQAPALPPRHQEAAEAIAQGDTEAALEAYRQALKENPGDDAAQAGIARLELMQRTSTMDADAVRTAGAQQPDDVQAQTDVADLDVVGGHVEDGFSRLVRFIAAHPGEPREQARVHLVRLYSVVGDQDPRVVASRRQLASALY